MSVGSDQRQRDFRVWIGQTRGVSVLACAASLIGGLFVALALQFAHKVSASSPDEPLTVDIGPWTVTAPDYAFSVLFAVTLLLTVASLTGSLLAQFDAHLARRYLRAVWEGPGAAGLRPQALLSERYLLDAWSTQLSVTIQALVMTGALVFVGGWREMFGVALAWVLMALVSLRFWRRSREASLRFVALRRERRKGAGRGPSEPDVDDASVGLLIDAMYERDTRAMRLSPTSMAVLSVGLLVSALAPMLVSGAASSLVLILMVLMIWRQRAIECVMGIGRLSWQITMWESAGLRGADPFAEDEG